MRINIFVNNNNSRECEWIWILWILHHFANHKKTTGTFASSKIDDRWPEKWGEKWCQNPPSKAPQLWSSTCFPKRCCRVLFWSFQSPAIFYWRLTTLLSCLTEKDGGNNGLYQDNGLSAFNEKPQEIEGIRGELCKIFWDNNLKITVKANIAKVNFLYVTLGLKAGKPYPYNKGNILLYVHKRSVTVCQNLMTLH